MKFDERYPDRPPGSTPAPALLREGFEGRCKCGAPTHWIDCAFGMYLCSEECRSKEWADFEKSNLSRGTSELQDIIQEENRLRARLSKYETVEGPFRHPIDCAMDSLIVTVGHLFPVEVAALSRKVKVPVPAHIEFRAQAPAEREKTLIEELISFVPFGPTEAEMFAAKVDLECTRESDHDMENCEKCGRLRRRIVIVIRAALEQQERLAQKR